jgi:hypothetical protein
MLRTVPVILTLLVAPGAILAHHSVAGFFDPADQVEIEGVIQKVRWRNPHTVFIVDVTEASGEVTTWTIESGALAVLRSRGLAREFVQPGDQVKILGDNSLRSRPEMFARNMLLANGEEVMLTAGSRPWFKTGNMLEAEFDQAIIDAAIANADGIFRVWSTNIDVRPTQSAVVLRGPFPLTPQAETVRDAYDASDEALLGCTGWSAPRIMANPLPMTFVREGEVILQRFEENDSVRTIYMDRDLSAAPEEPSMFGFSVGRWEGRTLVVETVGVIPDRINNTGIPTSPDMTLRELFTPTEDGKRLDYKLRITDPATFTEAVETGRYWEWRPEIQLRKYDYEQDQDLGQ